MKSLFSILISLIFIKSSVFGQNLSAKFQKYNGIVSETHSYNSPENFLPELVADDYGPRQLTRNGIHYNNDFHGGIDFNASSENSDLGAIINNISGGDVYKDSKITAGLKFITITEPSPLTIVHNFTYEHIFESGTILPNGQMKTGGGIIKFQDAPNQTNWCIIFQVNNEPAFAIGWYPGKVTFENEAGTELTIDVKKFVPTGSPVAILGNSGASNAHAHIQAEKIPVNNPGSNDKITKNPMEFISHITPDYKITIKQSGSTSGILPIYPGITLTPLKIEADINSPTIPVAHPEKKRYSKIGDIEKAELKIRNKTYQDNSQFKSLRGPLTDKIEIAGKFATQNWRPSHIRETLIDFSGSTTKTGVESHNYLDGYSDYFHFAEFYSIIHKNDPMDGGAAIFAKYPWDTRYPDGDYEMKGVITTVNNIEKWSDGYAFDIDNFQPFIERVQVYIDQPSNVHKIYERFWRYQAVKDEESMIKLSASENSAPPNNFKESDHLVVYAYGSESLGSSPYAEIIGLVGATIQAGIQVPIAGIYNLRKWKFDFGEFKNFPAFCSSCTTQISGGVNLCLKIKITGIDLNGNNLIDFGIPDDVVCPPNLTDFKKIPKRINKSATILWDYNPETGQDEVHWFKIKAKCGQVENAESFSPPCITSHDIKYEIYGDDGSNGGTIDLAISDDFQGVSIVWKNANGVPVAANHVVGYRLTGVPAGWYCYTIMHECCEVSDCLEIPLCGIEITSTVTSTPTGQCIGTIHTEGTNAVEPLTYTWDSGQNTPDLMGLCAGTYIITVSDFFNCWKRKVIDVIDCPVISISTGIGSLHQPSGCNIADGYFKVLNSNHATGGVAPYTYKWIDQNGIVYVPSASGSFLSGLGAGTYCLVATDANGCTGQFCISLHASHEPILIEELLPTCGGTNNGEIFIYAQDEDGGNYNFLWDDGFEETETNETNRNGLEEGEHCVTITSNQSICEVFRCYEIERVIPEPPLAASGVVDYCHYNNNCAINLTVIGGIPPYSYVWENGAVLEDRANLGKGFYSVTISDRCGDVVVKTFEVNPISFDLQAIAGCEGEGKLQAINIQGGFPPYKYKLDNGQWKTNPIFDHLNAGFYGYGVADSKGCQRYSSILLKNNEVKEKGSVNPCNGINFSGTANFEVTNPTNENVTVTVDNVTILTNQTASFVGFSFITSPNQVYHVKVFIGSCVKEFDFTPKTDADDIRFDRYDSDKKSCVSALFCHNEKISSDFDYLPPFIVDISGQFFHRCRNEIFCGGVSVGTFDGSKKWIRGAEYKVALDLAFEAGMFDGFTYEAMVNAYNNGLRSECDRLRICEQTFRILSRITVPKNLCHGIHIDVEIVINTIGDWHGNNSCHPRVQNAYQLILWHNSGQLAQIPNYSGSDLESLIINLKEQLILDGGGETSLGASCVMCMNVGFCAEDLTIVDELTDICSEIECKPTDFTYSYNEIGTCYIYGYGGVLQENPLILCNRSEGNAVNVVIENECFFCHPFVGENPQSLIVSEDSESNESFLNFGYVRLVDGAHQPNLIFRNMSGLNFYSLANSSSIQVSNQQADRLIGHFVDEKSNSSISTQKNTNQSTILIYDSNNTSWEQNLTSSNSLEVKDVRYSNQKITATGFFKGTLKISESTIFQSGDESAFVLYLDSLGVMLDARVVKNVQPSKTNFFFQNEKISVIGTSNSTWIGLNGQTHTLTNKGVFRSDIDFGTAFSEFQAEITVPAEMEIRGAALSNDGNNLAYLMEKTGISSSNNVNLLIQKGAEQPILVGLKSVKTDWSKISMTFDDSDHLFLGLTFTDSVNCGGQKFISKGQNDILILKFDEKGILEKAQQFGETGEESVEKLFFSGNELYFAGNFTGETPQLKIGEINFVNINKKDSEDWKNKKVYLSYLNLAENVPDLMKNSGAKLSKSKNNSERFISVYPNPTTGELNLKIDAPNESIEFINVSILNAVGKVIWKQQFENQTQRDLLIEASETWPTGIYFLKVDAATSNIQTIKIVKL